MDGAQHVVGVDVAASRPCVAVSIRCGRTLDVEDWCTIEGTDRAERRRLGEWIERSAPVAVAVDAPQRPRRSRDEGHPRAADAELAARRISVYQVPTRAAADASGRRYAWMQVGWDIFRELGRRGFEPPTPGALAGALGQAPAALEVYPYGTFAALLGGTPPSKGGRAGLHVRVTALRAAGVVWDEFFDHDSLDALAAALTAWRSVQGLATPLGDDHDGFVWLPVTRHDLRASYPRLSEHQALQAARRLGR